MHIHCIYAPFTLTTIYLILMRVGNGHQLNLPRGTRAQSPPPKRGEGSDELGQDSCAGCRSDYGIL